MATKNKKTVKKSKLSKEILSEIAYLEKLVLYSEKAKNGTSEELDDLFGNQADRLRLQIQKLKEKQ